MSNLNLNSRVNKLETEQGMGQRMKYQVVIFVGWAAGCWDTPEELAKGYKIQPWTKSAGGTGEKPFYLPTWEEVLAFRARDDVDLAIIQFGSMTDEQPSESVT